MHLLLPFVTFAQLPAPAPPAAAPVAGQAEVERVIVTGSNIPTAEETGPNPVDTYRPSDIEKLGIRNATDLQTFLPQEAGGTVNLNMGNGGDGTVQLNLRGLLPKETLVLVDGKRVAFGSLGLAGFSQGVDINLIPFPMIDHIDILKDGASAVYGSDAVTGVVNFFLIHKFRGLEIGGSYGNTNLGASNVADTTLVINGVPVPVTTGVRFRGINDAGQRSEKFTYWDSLFDIGLKGEMGEFGDYFKTWNWEAGFRYSRNEGQDLSVGEASQSTAEYGCSNWRWWLNNTTITLGMQNVFDEDPPFVAGSFENGYDESLATIKGRFWYVQLKKRF